MKRKHANQKLTPRELIEQRPKRRSYGENLLRRLMASSYPHALFANTAHHLVSGIDEQYFDIARDQMVAELAAVEREFSFLDFPRYIELQRQDDAIVITVRRLILDETDTAIKDQRHHHEDLAVYRLGVDDTVGIENAEKIAREWIGAHYQAAVPFQLRVKDLNDSKWTLQHKVMNASQGSNDLKDVRFTKETQPGGMTNVVNALKTSMEKPQFHIAMTPKAIFCFDQGLKITTERIK